MEKMKSIKNWVSKHKKFVIVGSVLFTLLVVIVCCVTFSLSGIYGSVYDVDSIKKNIDKIKVGDTINYTANGYSDWKVLSIDKENKSMDTISNGSVGDLTIKYEDVDNYLDILQSEANKYIDGKYAISARSIGDSSSELGAVDSLGYWIAYKDNNHLQHSFEQVYYSNYSMNDFSGYFMPLVTLNVNDSTSLSVGETYYYTLNGVSEWLILYKNDSTSISLVPKTPIKFELKESELSNFSSYITTEISKFKDSNVTSVRSVNSEDCNALYNIRSYFNYSGSSNYYIYTGVVSHEETSYKDSTYGGSKPTYFYDNFSLERLRLRQYSSCYSDPRNYELANRWVSGFVPIVTLKYSDTGFGGKDIDTDLKVGDNVKYSANSYNNWKVLNIDKEKGFVEIISSGIVKNLTLYGKEDYDNYEKILQEEVDKYKVGDNVITARAIDFDDIEQLKKIDKRLNGYFFINKKEAYRYRSSTGTSYGVYQGYYYSDSNFSYYTVTLADMTLYFDESMLTSDPNRYYSYTAGIRPIITLKLSEVKKQDSVKENDDSKFVVEQKKSNFNAQIVTEEKKNEMEVIDEEVVKNEESSKENVSTVDFSKLNYAVSKLEKSFEKVTTSNNILNFFIILTNGLSFVVIMSFLRKLR